MEFNKCSRCGSFFVHSGNVCPNCTSKDTVDISKLENYIQDFSGPETLEQLSYNTGISMPNLNRHINENPKFSGIVKFD